jgi:hypothetical protein
MITKYDMQKKFFQMEDKEKAKVLKIYKQLFTGESMWTFPRIFFNYNASGVGGNTIFMNAGPSAQWLVNQKTSVIAATYTNTPVFNRPFIVTYQMGLPGNTPQGCGCGLAIRDGTSDGLSNVQTGDYRVSATVGNFMSIIREQTSGANPNLSYAYGNDQSAANVYLSGPLSGGTWGWDGITNVSIKEDEYGQFWFQIDSVTGGKWNKIEHGTFRMNGVARKLFIYCYRTGITQTTAETWVNNYYLGPSPP